jgi:nicotinate-nucleotide adenylyltransferase
MLRIALQDCPDLTLDERELARDKLSYTYDSLQELRAELGAQVSLVLCMGTDAFTGLPNWHRGSALIELAHILVIERPGWSLPEQGAAWGLLQTYAREPEYLLQEPAGSVVLMSLRLLPVSATEIRRQIKTGRSAQFLVPDGVWKYINAHELYR